MEKRFIFGFDYVFNNINCQSLQEIPIRCVGTSKSDKTIDEYSPVRFPINVENMQSDDDNMTIQRIQKRSKATQEKLSENKKLRSEKNKEKC